MYADNNTPVGIICKEKCVENSKNFLHKPQGRRPPPTKSLLLRVRVPVICSPPVTGLWPELALSSGERPSQRSCGSANLHSSCERMLAGAERGFGSCPTTNNASPEVRIPSSPQLRHRSRSSELRGRRTPCRNSAIIRCQARGTLVYFP